MIQVKRAYDPVSETDGRRILVDHLWPRGVTKERAQLERWAKELAPSPQLCKWFAHDPAKWEEFQRQYREELKTRRDEINKLADDARTETITLIFAAKDAEHNNAVALKGAIEQLEQD